MTKLICVNDTINWLNKVLGKEQTIYLDTNIMKHLLDELDSGKTTNDVVKIVPESKTGKITMKSIKNAFEKINNNVVFNEAFDTGRSYFFEGFEETEYNKYKISWGS
jgi:hypothetical protein